MNFSNRRIELPRKLAIVNKFLTSSCQERSGSGESDFLIYWGKGKGVRDEWWRRGVTGVSVMGGVGTGKREC
jgi:hypothetical protein